MKKFLFLIISEPNIWKRVYLGYQTPENTIEAFKVASATGYQYLELDLQFTKDNILVL